MLKPSLLNTSQYLYGIGVNGLKTLFFSLKSFFLSSLCLSTFFALKKNILNKIYKTFVLKTECRSAICVG